jgi:hypothetical protein
MVVLFGAGAVVLGFLIPHAFLGGAASHSPHGGLTTLVLRIVIALVAFLPACQELDHLLLYRMVQNHLGEILKRVEALYSGPASDGQPDFLLLAAFGDYSAATTFAPPIRTLVYKQLKDQLRDEFEARMQSLRKV